MKKFNACLIFSLFIFISIGCGKQDIINGTTTTTTTSITTTTLSGSVYYVSTTGSDSTGDGSQSKPWATPGYGSRQLQAGNTLIIMGGTYVIGTDPTDVITPQNSGTSGSTINIQGETGNRPILVGRNNLIRAVDLSGRSYITIENLEITHDSSVSSSTLYFRNGVEIYQPATNITLKNLYIHHIDEYGINIQDVNGLSVESCTIEYCGYGAIGSSDMTSGNGWKNITIDNCDLSYNGHYYQGVTDNPSNPYDRPDGIGLEEGPGPIEVKNCLVEHNKGDGIDLKLSNASVHHNIVANNSCDGIKLWAGTTTVENNLIYGTGDGVGGSSPWASLVIGAPTGQTFTIVNNTFADNYTREAYIAYFQYDERSNINLTMRNNIFSDGQGLVWLASEITNYTIQSNLFNRYNNTDQIYVGGADRNISQLNALSNCSSNTSGDPQFRSPAWGSTGDYHLQSGSTAINTGTSSGAPSTDLDKASRPQGAGYDIGAYEQ